MAKETYLDGERALLTLAYRGIRKCQKRPIHMAKESYLYGKRGLLRLAYRRYARPCTCVYTTEINQCLYNRDKSIGRTTLAKRDLFA